jgi:hypothetical protein
MAVQFTHPQPRSPVSPEQSVSPRIQNKVVERKHRGRAVDRKPFQPDRRAKPDLWQRRIFSRRSLPGFPRAEPRLRFSFRTQIVDNVDTSAGMAIDLFPIGFNSSSQIANSILPAPPAQIPFTSILFTTRIPIFQFNDFDSSRTAIEGSCSGEIGRGGNLLANPEFKNATKHA